MAEKFSSSKEVEGFIDTVKLVTAAALFVFAFIGVFLTAPMRKD